MYFQHSPDIWRAFLNLVPGALSVTGIDQHTDVDSQVMEFQRIAAERLAGGTESGLPEFQEWRRTFAQTGFKPTQYRCASEALLRRFRKDGALPRLHPLIDLCNAISLAFAVSIAVFDTAKLSDMLEVRYADGSESYLTFGGEIEHPVAGEVIVRDEVGRAHARRWTNRQSGLSAVSESTSSVLVVAEAVHETAPDDMKRLTETLAEQVSAVWAAPPDAAILSASAPRFEC